MNRSQSAGFCRPKLLTKPVPVSKNSKYYLTAITAQQSDGFGDSGYARKFSGRSFRLTAMPPNRHWPIWVWLGDRSVYSYDGRA